MLVKAPAGAIFLSFAGCSAEGRKALVELAETRTESSNAAVHFLEFAVGKRDPLWPRCRATMEEIALDESRDHYVRYRAARIASKAPLEETFRKRFIVSALRSNEAGPIRALMLRYLPLNSDADQYVEGFAQCLKSDRPSVRDEAAVLFSLTCPAPLPEDTREPVVELIDSMVDNRSTRAAALMLMARLHKADSALPRRYATRLIKLARHEPEPLHFADLIHAAAIFSEGGFDPSFPFDPSSYSDSDQRAAAARWIEAHRQEVQAKADAWLRAAENDKR